MSTDQSQALPAMTEADHCAAVETLSKQLFASALQQASSTSVALNSLVTAYINCAAHLGVLDRVPAMAAAMSDAAVQLRIVEQQLRQGRAGTNLH
ncbi:hypothetical protein [Paracidovorax cattleyae]|uniref:hypothetical protein n=1 Tax=Paracidovorax cattleyae TaxID=80868 RepID=UPI0018AF6EAC|nr:hypothetical protein [Paracidovorax cattleyae]MBF9265237.1 hypothetical protein [Paracidovorax cattleyae]